MTHDIIIIGGGLSGLTAGIALQRKGRFASAHTRSASVESSPPEIPITRFEIPVALTRVASPLA